jgi:hypothetical protein
VTYLLGLESCAKFGHGREFTEAVCFRLLRERINLAQISHVCDEADFLNMDANMMD